MKIFFAILLLLLFSVVSESKNYIIIADSWYQKTEFRDNTDLENEMGIEIINKYKGMILHLGSEKAFERGGYFFYDTSKQKLKQLTDMLKSNDKKVYLWFFDSFGSDSFNKLYEDHKIKINKIKSELNKMKILYDGIVVDMEWINYQKKSDINNSIKYNEILTELKKQFPNKEIMAFASLVNDEKENQNRGYDLNELNKIGIKLISMLYIKDDGFINSNGYPVPVISSRRVDELRAYYQKNGINISVALDKGIIIKRNLRYYFIRNFRKFDKDIDAIMSNLQYVAKKENENYTLEIYKAKQNFKIQKNDKTYEEIKKEEEIYVFTVKKSVLRDNDFIWEYYKLY